MEAVGRAGDLVYLIFPPIYTPISWEASCCLSPEDSEQADVFDQRTIIIRRPVVVSPTGFDGDLHSLHSRSKIATTKCSNILSEVRRVLLSVRIDAAYSAIISVPAKLHYFVMNQKRRRGKIYRHRSAFSPFLLLVDFFRWSDDDAADEQCFCIHGWVDTSSSGSLDLGSKIRSC